MPDETYRTVTPYLVVADADAEIRFLETAFGAMVQSCQRDQTNRVMHSEIQIGDSLIMMGEANEHWKALPAGLYLWVKDVDQVYAKAIAAGAASRGTPEDKPYGHRIGGVLDECGITWWIGAPVKSAA